jgi:hypothetical protein
VSTIGNGSKVAEHYDLTMGGKECGHPREPRNSSKAASMFVRVIDQTLQLLDRCRLNVSIP